MTAWNIQYSRYTHKLVWYKQDTLSQWCRGHLQTACGLAFSLLFALLVPCSCSRLQCTAGFTTVPRAVCATFDSLSRHSSKSGFKAVVRFPPLSEDFAMGGKMLWNTVRPHLRGFACSFKLLIDKQRTFYSCRLNSRNIGYTTWSPRNWDSVFYMNEWTECPYL